MSVPVLVQVGIYYASTVEVLVLVIVDCTLYPVCNIPKVNSELQEGVTLSLNKDTYSSGMSAMNLASMQYVVYAYKYHVLALTLLLCETTLLEVGTMQTSDILPDIRAYCRS